MFFLENPRDGGAWWAAVSGVAQSRTRLKLLSCGSSPHGKRRPEGGADVEERNVEESTVMRLKTHRKLKGRRKKLALPTL